MKNLTKCALANFLLLAGIFIIVSGAEAATVACQTTATWPQKVVVDGFAHSCGSGKNFCNFEKASQGIGECCATYGPYANCAAAGPRSIIVNTDFFIDAWTTQGWVACEDQTGSRDQLDAFCKSKGYTGIWGGTEACYHEIQNSRWTWNGSVPMTYGNYTGRGYALTQVKCAKTTTFCTENWSCGAWSYCRNGQQTRTCTDASGCLTTDNKPATTQGCESLSCATPIPGQEVIEYYKGDGTGLQFMCNSLYSHCKVDNNRMVGRCCPQTNSLNADCMVMYPARTTLQGSAEMDKKTLGIGETWSPKGGLVLKANMIDTQTNPKQVQLSLFNKGVQLDDKVIEQNKYYLYTPDSFQQYTNFNLFGVYIDSIFSGAVTNMVQLRYAYHNSLWENDISCTENWSCADWSTCNNGQQTRTCTDANNCGATANKPATSQNCCAENWSCGSWSACSDGNQTRTCTDANSCGTVANKPAVSQRCSCAESWSCGDWSACANSQQTRACADANNCGTTIDKPATQQTCQNQCQESWTCGTWSACQNNQQTRACSDINNCGTTGAKPTTTQTCNTVCVENWSCGNWANCANGWETRTCADLNNCGTIATKPATAQKCAEPATATPGASSSAPAEETNNNATVSIPISAATAPLPELKVANPRSNVFFGGRSADSYLPDETIKFYYKYQNITDKPVTIKIVRQMINAKGKAIFSAQAYKTLKAGGALAVEVKQNVSKSWPAGDYKVSVKIFNAKNKALDENSFAVKLKKKVFILNEKPADADIAWDEKVWSKAKANAPLPANLKLRFSYTNNSGAKHVVRMARELIDENGKVRAMKTGKWIMTAGEKDAVTFAQPLSDALPLGKYNLRIRAYDWTTKEILAENSASLTIEAK